MTDEGPVAEDAYDELADEYAETVEENPYNAHLDFPATTDLVPDVEGKRVLDAGCGSGRYAEWLLDRGADVVGVDASEAMLDHAADRVGDRAELRRADLAEPLGFAADDAFDGVVSALVLGYVQDWRDPFREFARVVRPGGFVVFSVTHPFDEFPLDESDDYFAVERRTKEWSVDVPYYRRPLTEVFDPVLDAGFRIEAVAEPRPTEAFREQRPERYEKESKRPVFLAMRVRKA
ncbi:class I SAM-dependent methyltransferase [Halomicrobium salinisoli]|uniref:class I SAM-dependent methyltransferase n=1 Tax=Halomicrobium salinisoli TaxID=2878391 RepID=UPI001CF093B6|nr:class I SAM-dependent methyltransferase [Halomicrobium salinisoli]